MYIQIPTGQTNPKQLSTFVYLLNFGEESPSVALAKYACGLGQPSFSRKNIICNHMEHMQHSIHYFENK